MNKIKKQKKNNIMNKVTFLLVGIIMVLLIYIGNLMYENDKISKELETANNTIKSMTETISMMDNRINNQDNNITSLTTTIEDLDKQLKEVSNINKSYVDELTELRSRAELYDKYSYAIMDEGNRTELTYAEIKLGEELMLSNGYDPNLMFGTIMVESRANPNAVNPSSQATGYGQFLNSTAEFVWTKLMGNSNYSREIMKDGESNIKMMAEYYDYLYNTKGSTYEVIKQYSGNSTDEGALNYLSKINSFTKKVGVIIK